MGSKQSNLKPEVVEDLQGSTDFTEAEINEWYKCFNKNSPDGLISVAEFKRIYGPSFPLGGAFKLAEYVFQTFDTDQDGVIDFREFMRGLHVTSRGTPDERIAWAFSMYDPDGDGFVQRHEMVEMVAAVHGMITLPTRKLADDQPMPKTRVDKIGQRETNKDVETPMAAYAKGTKK